MIYPRLSTAIHIFAQLFHTYPLLMWLNCGRMAFTTWTAYLAQLKDILADASAKGFLTLNQFGAVGPDGIPATYRNLDELKRWVNWVESKVVAEGAATDGRGRRLFLGGVR